MAQPNTDVYKRQDILFYHIARHISLITNVVIYKVKHHIGIVHGGISVTLL